MSYNIRLGVESSLDEVGRRLAALQPDLVALQELGQHWVMGGEGDQLGRLGEACGLSARRFGGALCLDPAQRPWSTAGSGLPEAALRFLATPGPRVRAVGAAPARFGLGLLARWPLDEPRLLLLPRREDEQRVLLCATLRHPETPLCVATAHLSVRAAERRLQAAAVAAALRGCELPVALLGDLNDEPGSECLAALLAAGLQDAAQGAAAQPTFPAAHPRQRLDFALLHPSLRVRAVQVPEVQASDHRPLVVDLD